MKNNVKRKYAIYSRKSKFTGKGDSIENQIELCRKHIKMLYLDVTDEDIVVFEDEGFSGGNTDRPEFIAMLNEAKNNNLQAVVCYRLDRISRKVVDFSELIDELAKRDVAFISIKEQFDTSTPMGRAMMYISSVFAQLERETIAERVRDNMYELAKTGRWLGGTTPTGYRSKETDAKIKLDGKMRTMFKLDMIEEEASLIKLIFDKFIETNALTKVETYLMQNHILSKNGKRFTRFSIKSILQNPVYMSADKNAWDYFEQNGVIVYNNQEEFDGRYGIMAYNKTVQSTGKSHDMREMEEWIVAIGKHKPIIISENWIKVQRMLGQNSSKSYRKPRSNTALLSGLLYCSECGNYMRPKMGRRVDYNGNRVFSYLCETKEKSQRKLCNSKNPSGNALDKLVCEPIKALSEDKSDFMNQLKSAKKAIRNTDSDYESQLSVFKDNISKNEAKIKALVNTLTKMEGIPAYDYISMEISELHESIQQSKKGIEELKQQKQQHEIIDDQFDIIEELLGTFGKSFETMNIEEKRMALRVFIERIEWDGTNAQVYLFGADRGNKNGMDIATPLGVDSK